MLTEKRIAFVVNPISGRNKAIDMPALISQNLSNTIAYDILVWENASNFEEIRNQITSGKYSIVVAVGGDGTVNAVAKNLLNTGITLGIIPRGSGNGLARSLGIPQNTIKAIKRIETGTIRTIDSGIINDKPFFCAAGIGFDAHICQLFALTKNRGLSSYIKIGIQQFFSYKPKEYSIEVNNETLKIKAFVIAFANAGQYGNDFYIAPQAKMDDGLLHIVILKPFTLIEACYLLVKVLNRKAHLAKNILTLTAQSIKIKNLTTEAIHFDGEPDLVENELLVSIHPQSLKVLC
ncbi:MAG: diacylglycerol/lipid kinase family protein [Bacteroidia bacterium]